MKTLLSVLILAALLIPAEASQKRKAQTRPRVVNRKPASPAAKPPASPLAGMPVLLITRNGDKIAGTILDMNAFSMKSPVRRKNRPVLRAAPTLRRMSRRLSPLSGQ
jgi:hypothetical protein